MAEIFDIQNLKINKRINVYDSVSSNLEKNVFAMFKIFESKNVLIITNNTKKYLNVFIKPEDLDGIDVNQNYVIKSPFTDEVFFKMAKDIAKKGFEFLVSPEETFVYYLDGYSVNSQYFDAIRLILKDMPISLNYVKKYIKNFDFLEIIKSMLFHSQNKYSFQTTKFYTSFATIHNHDYLFIYNENSNEPFDTLKSEYFNVEIDQKDKMYFMLEDIFTGLVYLRRMVDLANHGFNVLLDKDSAHFFRIKKVMDNEIGLLNILDVQLANQGVKSNKFFQAIFENKQEIPKLDFDHNFMEILKDKNVVYLCMEMLIPEFYEQIDGKEYNGAVDANFNGGLGILAGCTMEGFANIGLKSYAVIPMYRKRLVQKIDENLKQQIYQVEVDYSTNKNLEKVIDEETGEQLEIQAFANNVKYAVKIWKINRGGSIVYLLDEPKVFDILYTGSREHRLLQEVLHGKVSAVLLRTLDIQPAVIHLNEAHTVLSAVNIKEWKNITNGDDFFEDTRILFTIHTPRAAGMEVFFTAFEHLEIPYSYRRIFDPDHKNKLDFTNAASELADRINTVSNNQIRIVKERILQNEKFHNKIIGIMNGSSKSYWMADNVKRFLEIEEKNINPSELWNATIENKQSIGFLDVNKPSAWAVRRIVDYKNQWPFLKDIIRQICLTREQGGLGFQVVVGGMAHVNDKNSQNWINEFCNWAKGKWRSDMNHEFEDAPELIGNFFFIPAEEDGLGKLLKKSAIASDVCLEIPEWDEEACGTSGMRTLTNAGICVDSSDGALEWGKDSENSFILKPYTKERLFELIKMISDMYYSDRNSDEFARFLQMKKNAFITWRNILDIDIMSSRYAKEMFYPAVLAREICK